MLCCYQPQQAAQVLEQEGLAMYCPFNPKRICPIGMTSIDDVKPEYCIACALWNTNALASANKPDERRDVA